MALRWDAAQAQVQWEFKRSVFLQPTGKPTPTNTGHRFCEGFRTNKRSSAPCPSLSTGQATAPGALEEEEEEDEPLPLPAMATPCHPSSRHTTTASSPVKAEPHTLPHRPSSLRASR